MTMTERAAAPVGGHPDVDRVRRATLAVTVMFALNGAAFATFAARLPDVKSLLGLSPAGLGLFLISGSIGSVIGLPMSGWVAGRLGARIAVRTATLVTTAAYLATGVAVGTHHHWTAVAFLMIAGWGIGLWDVVMNLEGAIVERHRGRSIMPRFHAMFSGGTVLAALIGAAATAAHVPVWLHIGVVMCLLAAVGMWAALNFESVPRLDGKRPDAETTDPSVQEKVSSLSVWLDPRVLLIGVVTLVAAFTEGTANDWLSLAFVEGHHVPKWAGVLAFAIFLSCMTAGRLVGTKLLDTYGRVLVLRVCFSLAVVGCLVVVFGPTALAYLGIVVWGVGVSLGFPVGMSAAADDPAHANARISVISTIAYTAFLAGPPFLGLLGEHVGVLHALLAVGAAATIALALVPAVREPETPAPAPEDRSPACATSDPAVLPPGSFRE
ncbi:MAG TPA: MFS transporter [Flexivirga sp.]|uniref:MFS transporter n=1 Tax=Flexivirga sp. TaxID=1962927 RepID=UPI002BA645C8|nr:MFS transporter [Flexivirga sp.]HWC23476.1 MFS transporter [Flexivirga sp.]